ncbi:Ribosomal RNA small subunit methyltransferase E [compost metagenome]
MRLKDERADKRLAHWRQIAVSACEQCGRSQVPVIHAPVLLADWLKLTDAALKLVLHPVAEPLVSHTKPASLAFLIGPEGGLTEGEVDQAKAAGFHAARLGPRVLRTETAPVVALAVAQQLWGDF